MREMMVILLVVLFGFSSSLAQTTYTWTGTVDGDWTNADNWDTNGVPVDFEPDRGGLSFQGSADRIVINATNHSPSNNVPTLAADPGGSPATFHPAIDVINGTAAFTISNTRAGGNHALSTGVSTTIGDGDVSTGLASLTYSGSHPTFRRTGNVAYGVTVNRDGTLNFADHSNLSSESNRGVRATLAGGAVTFNGAIRPVSNSASPGINWFDFTEAGATFTASFGGSIFPDLAAVEAYIEDQDFFRSTADLTLAARDIGDGRFEVYIPPPFGTLIIIH